MRYLRLLVVVSALLAAARFAVGQTALPEGFEAVEVVSGLNLPTAMAFAPDDRLFVCEKNGSVRVFKQGQLLPQPFVQISLDSAGERGLLGIAFDPDFTTNRYVYLYYTTGPGSLQPPQLENRNRVSRFTADGDVALPGSETILVNDIPSPSDNHNAGCLRFGPDGKLYISTGDGSSTPTASQDLASLSGKILRIEKNGAIPADNPFAGQAGRRGEIYCYGLRNPFRFHFRPGTGTLFIGDVGQDRWEEVNVSQPGANFGWPTYEGPTNVPGYVGPVFAYENVGGASITGGCFISNSNYPVAYQGSYFYGDYARNTLGRLVFNPDNTLAQAVSFGTAPGPVDFAQGPDGDLYFISITTGSVRKIRYVGQANRAPIARATGNPLAGPAPLAVAFSSEGSSDPDADPLTFTWTFGDGATSTLPNPSHTYSVPGNYTVTLDVSDGRGGTTRAAPLTIQVGNNAPTVRILSPADESLYSAGDAIQFRGTATDPEDGTLPDAAMEWTITFYHAEHTHPFQTISGVSQGSVTIPRTGETATNVWYEFCLTATDSGGARGTACVQIRPRTVQLGFATNPKGLTVTVDGRPLVTPVTVPSVVGFDHLVGVPDQQVKKQVYTWRSWSDGGAQTHTIRAPATNTTYTATLRNGR